MTTGKARSPTVSEQNVMTSRAVFEGLEAAIDKMKREVRVLPAPLGWQYELPFECPRDLSYSAALALAIAQASERLGKEYSDPVLIEAGKKLELLAQHKLDAAKRAWRAIGVLKGRLSIS
jgi:hypothetical protein